MDPNNQNYLASLYPLVEEKSTSLPKRWHQSSKNKNLSLSNRNLTVQYQGNAKSKDAGTVRADAPIPPLCGAYYFEIRVTDKGKDGYIGIGLNRGAAFKSDRHPGWEKDSYGYHGDDGNAFMSNTMGVEFGPKFGTGDIVGCGINFAERCIFFTLNGLFLGSGPFTDIAPSANFYPVVGLQSQGETVEANFGSEKFAFDFPAYLTETRDRVRAQVARHPVSNKHGEWVRTVDSLVCGLLVHHGYSGAAEALAKSARIDLIEPAEDIRSRQGLLSLLLKGDLDEALRRTEELHPGLLAANPNLHFQLKCRQFIELVSRTDVSSAIPQLAVAAAASVSGDVEMREEGSSAVSKRDVEKTTDIDRIFQLGRELHTLRVNHGLDQAPFADAISLLAYEQPAQSPMSHLLDSEQREPLARALNSAILESRCQPSRPALEVALSQAARCLSALSKHSADGSVAFVAEGTAWLK
ncbi:hypothetical protein BOX15_Mlig018214g3 [Macrostomum lignano]|uniref:Ran-binding protein 10 n=2 Tax=Macrostomum lignano TaxID=282301 RepID=A0A1I8J7L4_9PLAT|nr:hypothetical protein BOX15_Mlig018214g3 [Macrostomum lignano]